MSQTVTVEHYAVMDGLNLSYGEFTDFRTAIKEGKKYATEAKKALSIVKITKTYQFSHTVYPNPEG